jgi:sec-independent protein translocase protein TatC
LMVVFGIAFLLPLLVVMLNFLGVVKAAQLRKYRTYVIFGTFVFGAVATPSTDPFSMLALALPMTLLFLAAEGVSHIHDRRVARRLALAGPDSVPHSIEGDLALQELSEHDEPDART